MNEKKKLIESITQNYGIMELLDLMPCGVSIATDKTCETIIHNSISARFLRITQWSAFSHSASEPPPVQILSNGLPTPISDLPIQRAAWNGETVVGVELEFVWSDGIKKIGLWSASPLVSSSGEVSGVIATCEDITERKILERQLASHRDQLQELVAERTEKLKRSEQYIRTLVDNIPMIISRFDTQLRHVYVNSASEALCGVKADDCIGKTWGDMGIDESLFLSFKKDYETAFATGQSQEFETQFPNANNEIAYFRTLVIPEKREDGQVTSVLSIAQDITSRKKFEAEMARIDRLNLVGEMAASIGHEVRNPLTTVRGYLQYFQGKKEITKYQEQFQTMIDELDRANQIITEFLSLAKNKAVELRLYNLNTIISTLQPLILADALRCGHSVQFELGTVPDIQLAEKELRQLLLNLTRNSFEAMSAGGMLEILSYVERDYLVLAVHDNGPGIPERISDKLGTPFVTTKENGIGLGLAVCYRIAERHGATIDVQTSSQGTTFLVKFKLCVGNEA